MKRIYEIPSRKAMTSGAMTEIPDKSAFVKYLVRRLKTTRNLSFFRRAYLVVLKWRSSATAAPRSFHSTVKS